MRVSRILWSILFLTAIFFRPAPAWALPDLGCCFGKNPMTDVLTVANCPTFPPCSCDAGTEGSKCLMNYTAPLFTSVYQCAGLYCGNGSDSCACNGSCCFGIGCDGPRVSCTIPVVDCGTLCTDLAAQALQACQGIGPGHPGGSCVSSQASFGGHSAKFELCCPQGQVVTSCGPGGTGDSSCSVLVGATAPPTCAAQFKCNCPGVQISCGNPPPPPPTPTQTRIPDPTQTSGPGATPTATAAPTVQRAPVPVRLRQ